MGVRPAALGDIMEWILALRATNRLCFRDGRCRAATLPTASGRAPQLLHLMSTTMKHARLSLDGTWLSRHTQLEWSKALRVVSIRRVLVRLLPSSVVPCPHYHPFYYLAMPNRTDEQLLFHILAACFLCSFQDAESHHIR